MQLEGYEEWIEVFDEEISKLYLNSEIKELQKTVMLFGALEQEIKKVQSSIKIELSLLKEQFEEKHLLEKKFSTLSPKKIEVVSDLKNKENKKNLIVGRTSEIRSPDLFKNFHLYRESSLTNSSISDYEAIKIDDDDITNVETSPTIKSKFKKIRNPKCKKKGIATKPAKSLKNITYGEETDNDLSVIDCTPEATKSKIDNSKSKMECGKKIPSGWKSTSLTPIFSNSFKRKIMPHNVLALKHDSHETYYEENSDDEQMPINDLLNYINQEQPMSTDSSKENHQLFNSPNKKAKLKTIEAEPVVRGKARKELRGFSCKNCERFYKDMKLPPEELRKKIDECSKHRYKYAPPEETMPGFWDLSFDTPAN